MEASKCHLDRSCLVNKSQKGLSEDRDLTGLNPGYGIGRNDELSKLKRENARLHTEIKALKAKVYDALLAGPATGCDGSERNNSDAKAAQYKQKYKNAQLTIRDLKICIANNELSNSWARVPGTGPKSQPETAKNEETVNLERDSAANKQLKDLTSKYHALVESSAKATDDVRQSAAALQEEKQKARQCQERIKELAADVERLTAEKGAASAELEVQQARALELEAQVEELQREVQQQVRVLQLDTQVEEIHGEAEPFRNQDRETRLASISARTQLTGRSQASAAMAHGIGEESTPADLSAPSEAVPRAVHQQVVDELTTRHAQQLQVLSEEKKAAHTAVAGLLNQQRHQLEMAALHDRERRAADLRIADLTAALQRRETELVQLQHEAGNRIAAVHQQAAEVKKAAQDMVEALLEQLQRQRQQCRQHHDARAMAASHTRERRAAEMRNASEVLPPPRDSAPAPVPPALTPPASTPPGAVEPSVPPTDHTQPPGPQPKPPPLFVLASRSAVRTEASQRLEDQPPQPPLLTSVSELQTELCKARRLQQTSRCELNRLKKALKGALKWKERYTALQAQSHDKPTERTAALEVRLVSLESALRDMGGDVTEEWSRVEKDLMEHLHDKETEWSAEQAELQMELWNAREEGLAAAQRLREETRSKGLVLTQLMRVRNIVHQALNKMKLTFGAECRYLHQKYAAQRPQSTSLELDLCVVLTLPGLLEEKRAALRAVRQGVLGAPSPACRSAARGMNNIDSDGCGGGGGLPGVGVVVLDLTADSEVEEVEDWTDTGGQEEGAPNGSTALFVEMPAGDMGTAMNQESDFHPAPQSLLVDGESVPAAESVSDDDDDYELRSCDEDEDEASGGGNGDSNGGSDSGSDGDGGDRSESGSEGEGELEIGGECGGRAVAEAGAYWFDTELDRAGHGLDSSYCAETARWIAQRKDRDSHSRPEGGQGAGQRGRKRRIEDDQTPATATSAATTASIAPPQGQQAQQKERPTRRPHKGESFASTESGGW